MLRTNIRARWTVATLVAIFAAILGFVTKLDDMWLQLALVGGDRIALQAKARETRIEAMRAMRTTELIAPITVAPDAKQPIPEPTR